VLDGDRLTLHELRRFVHGPQRLPSGLHWDLTGLWKEALAATRLAVAWARERQLPLVSLGVDTWGVDYGLLGRSGELLGLPHAYRDERNTSAFENTLARLGRESIYRATGIQFMPLNTLYQLVAQHESEPDLVARADRLLFMPDLLHYFFTGRMSVEASIASTSQMMDPRTGDWAWALLQELGLPTHMLGPIVPAGTPIGGLLPHVAADTGADEGLRVITPAAHDTASAVAAIPADEGTNWCYLSSGTWSLLGAELDHPCLSDAAREVPFTNEAGVGGTIRFLKNITGLWLVQECRRQLARDDPRHDYDDLMRAAAKAESFRTLLDTDHAPFAAPGRMPEKIAAFARATGQPEPRDVGELIRCCLESLALAYRRALDLLERVLGRRFDILHIVGGGGRNELLNQMTAAATGRKVVVGPYEATAAGNILVQAMDTGTVRDRAHLRRIVSASFSPATYEPRNVAAWDKAYARYEVLLAR